MRWIWIDKFVDFTPGQQAVAVKNVSRAEDHLHDQFPAFPLMPMSLVIEGMAQTAGILVGHARSFSERVILAKIRRAKIDQAIVPGDQLHYKAEIEHIDDQGAMTAGEVSLNGSVVGNIDLVFSHLDPEVGATMGIPRDNFVFHEDFKRLVRTLSVAEQQKD